MSIELTTPALLFSTISLLLLAYTNRFLALATVIRSLHREYQQTPNPIAAAQILNLRKRVNLIRDMQTLGVASLLSCTICMGLLFAGQIGLGKIVFGFSLILMVGSLAISLWEIRMSVGALNLQLGDLEKLRTGLRPRPMSDEESQGS
ncbi:DUF2721 domain-containing protein [Aporhodopirellula aestuarii]|uniref:DUF2721 domain-containing protein n=1 Tax=Aporhodopirellula aestuarii TaxID=2950107 RepID=A0ABT0U1A2_9BACT|nr:DUF2721 domain-containing protein [Aporhodopirellula aestuarii]MCM2370268.1 DUF2721 domain-containing protein [Aporhodopirellula aestuarii]